MLLNEFLKEHRKVEKLEGTVAELKSALKEQAAQIEKISTRLEASQSAPRVVRTIDLICRVEVRLRLRVRRVRVVERAASR
jgi:hypothetical protein